MRRDAGGRGCGEGDGIRAGTWPTGQITHRLTAKDYLIKGTGLSGSGHVKACFDLNIFNFVQRSGQSSGQTAVSLRIVGSLLLKAIFLR